MNKNSVAGLFAIVVGTIVFLASNNLLLTLAVFIFALVFAMTLRPFYQKWFEKKEKAAPTTISVLRERGFENGTPEERVLYVLLITQDVTLDVENAEQRALLEDIFEKSAVSLSENYDFFRSRYSNAQEKELPLKICCGTCNEKKNSVGKCYRDWMKTVRIDNNTYPGRENVDIFFHDLQFTDQDGITRNAVTAVRFYRW